MASAHDMAIQPRQTFGFTPETNTKLNRGNDVTRCNHRFVKQKLFHAIFTS